MGIFNFELILHSNWFAEGIYQTRFMLEIKMARLLSIVLVFFLYGCQSTSEPDYDVREYHEADMLISVELKISDVMPKREFMAAVKEKLTATSNGFSLLSYTISSDNTYIIFHEGKMGSSNTASYTMPVHIRFYTMDGYHVARIDNSITSYIGTGWGFTNQGAEMTSFRFDDIENMFMKNISTLTDITYTTNHLKEYSGTTTLKNDDTTAFANIQRIHKDSYLSTNTKTDSEKTGVFKVSYDKSAFHFALYPYKTVSKVQYSYKIPYKVTYYSFDSRKSSEGKPSEMYMDKGRPEKVLASAVSSFNN